MVHVGGRLIELSRRNMSIRGRGTEIGRRCPERESPRDLRDNEAIALTKVDTESYFWLLHLNGSKCFRILVEQYLFYKPI